MATGGNEKGAGEPDKDFGKKPESPLNNLASRDLIELWRIGSQAAADILWARYEVRLVALVAARLSRRLRGGIAAEDIVQSALGSFFRVTQANTQRPLQLDSTASAWNLLATFARRKLARALERETAFKRGGGRDRAPLDDVADQLATPSNCEADVLLAELQTLLTDEQTELLQLLLEDFTQREIAERLQVDERTVRRRIAAMRAAIAQQWEVVENSALAPATTNPPINLPRMTYGQFLLGQLVGRGALGKVYRARLQADDQVVAVKFMHRHLWSNATSQLSFLREIDLAARIRHRGIVRYIAWGTSPHGGPYLVTEYIDGTSLACCQPQDASSAVQWLVQICQAIAVAHEHGVVHGDLTPNNVLIAHDGRIVITDFGFASCSPATARNSDEPSLQLPRGGTLGFAAPEQLSPAFGQIGPATDLYAIGGLAYYFLEGRPPHVGSAHLGSADVDSAHTGPPDAVTATLSDIDIVLSDVHRMPAEVKLVRVAELALKKAVADRPSSVAPLLDLLAD